MTGTTLAARDLNREYQDNEERKYAYDFDYLMHHYMMQTFAPFLPTGRALEMGCYKGEFTRRLSQHFSDVTVVEGSSDLLEEARKNVGTNVRFLHGQFENIILDEQFDAIFLVHTLEHLDEPVAVLKRINRWLSPLGKLFLAVPNANAPSRQIAVRMGLIAHNAAVTEGEAAHGHCRTYSLDTLERDALRAGLAVRHRGGVFFKPFANFQFDRLMQSGIIDQAYLDGCYRLGMVYPDLCASIYLLCGKGV
jgi:2-polyprenyl-3-methyl-5-hydroxy-6-metoxy-1,4-benzoquinol methylase